MKPDDFLYFHMVPIYPVYLLARRFPRHPWYGTRLSFHEWSECATDFCHHLGAGFTGGLWLWMVTLSQLLKG